MSFFNIDPNIKRYPPEKVRIKSVKVIPYEDGRRIQISIEITPFLERPLIELEITDETGNNFGKATIVEPPFWKQELTMHVRKSETQGFNFKLKIQLIYPDVNKHPMKSVDFRFPLSDQPSK